MKYLRGIFESIVPEFMEELKDFCESNLVYLIDEGFTLEFSDNTESSYRKEFGGITVRLSKYSIGRNNLIGDYKHFSYFNWDDIKDYYIPFLERLSREYKTFDKCLIKFAYGESKVYYINHHMEDRLGIGDKSIYSISIKVGDKL